MKHKTRLQIVIGLVIAVIAIVLYVNHLKPKPVMQATGGTGVGLAQDATGQAILTKFGLTTPQGGTGYGLLQDSTMQVVLQHVSSIPNVPDAGSVNDAGTVIYTGNTTDSGTSWQTFSNLRVTPLDSNDLHAWELQETGGTTANDTGSSPNPINLTLTTATNGIAFGNPGILGNCVCNQAGVTTTLQSVDISGATGSQPGADLPTGSSTVEYWYYSFLDTFPATAQTIFEETGGTTGADVNIWLVGPNTSSSTYQVYLNDGSSAPFGTINGYPRPNFLKWQYVALTYDGSIYRLYVDGQLTYTSAASQTYVHWTTAGGSTPRTIGIIANSASTSTTNLTGCVTRVRISNIARTQSYLEGVYQRAMLY